MTSAALKSTPLRDNATVSKPSHRLDKAWVPAPKEKSIQICDYTHTKVMDLLDTATEFKPALAHALKFAEGRVLPPVVTQYLQTFAEMMLRQEKLTEVKTVPTRSKISMK